jgi:UDP-N-acetylglucosamine 2-epimerase (non-hydrolysing)
MPVKVMTIVGTRPELIKLSRVISELDRYTQHILVHSGQNYDYELNQIFFEDLGMRQIDHFLDVVGSTTAETIGNIISKADAVMARENPEALLLLGDTNTCLAAIPAKRRKIPIFHMEAGNRCFDQRVPEEINRKIVDHLSDINLTYTEHARRYLLMEGLRPETVIKTGSPMKEVLSHYRPQIEGSAILASLGLATEGYLLVSAHREENIDSDANFGDLLNTLPALGERYHRPVIVSTHPRTRKRLEETESLELENGVRFLKPLGFFDYVKLQLNAFCVVSDSGTITEESAILDFPAVTIRQAYERPEGMDEGTLIMCGLKAARVIQAIEVVTSQQERGERRFAIPPDYAVDNVSQKVVRIILSYIDYVNRTVWHKH